MLCGTPFTELSVGERNTQRAELVEGLLERVARVPVTRVAVDGMPVAPRHETYDVL